MFLLDLLFVIGGFSVNTGSSAISTYKAKRNVDKGEMYLALSGYNPKRQQELFRMSRAELGQLLGRRIPLNKYNAFTDAVKEQLEREGFKYLDRLEVMRKDPAYRACAGIKTMPGDVTFNNKW